MLRALSAVGDAQALTCVFHPSATQHKGATMALTTFETSYTISHTIVNPDAVCVEQGDVMTVVLADHPITGSRVFDDLELTTSNNAYYLVWKNATGVSYLAEFDQITGTIYTPGPPDINNDPTYIERKFCMSLCGDPATRANKLNCYVSASVSGGSPDPDDGSWAGDVD
jgi:hypothetical protein